MLALNVEGGDAVEALHGGVGRRFHGHDADDDLCAGAAQVAGQPPLLVSGGGPGRIRKHGEVEFVQVSSDQHPPRVPVGPGAGEQRHAQQLRRPVFGKLGRAR